jgi:mono/diheme cytochrome c family protein
MSDGSKGDRDTTGSRAKREGDFEPYEQRDVKQPDVQQIHGPIYREKAEPRDGYQPIPMWLLLPVFALLLWGGWYLGEHSGDFRPDRYEGPAAFVGSPDRAAQQSAQRLDPMVVGRRIYNSCAACHQVNGQGVAGAFPPLAGAEWVTGDPRILSRILLHGMQGPISVLGTKYEGVMPAWANLSNEEIAAVLTYIRNSWGNQAGDVSAELVGEVRESVGRRSDPWTADELKQIERQLRDQGSETNELAPSEDSSATDSRASGENSE